MITIKNIWNFEFLKNIEANNGIVYAVGGCVRDYLMNNKSKDIDLVVFHLNQDYLINLLKPYGKVDVVGESFGVIKFIPTDHEDVIDIALPRTEINDGNGHRDFDVNVDPNLSIETELYRRDFTINAIAINSNFLTIDPYDGEMDIKNKIVRLVNPEAFADDPLRMLRALQFAARFGFYVDGITFSYIINNKKLIKNITTERVMMEFNKVFNKGFIKVKDADKLNNTYPLKHFVQLLEHSGLFETYFGIDIRTDYSDFEKIHVLADFYYLLFAGHDQFPSYWYKEVLNGNSSIYKFLKALEEIFYPTHNNKRKTLSNALSEHEQVMLSGLIPSKYYNVYVEFLDSQYPMNIKDLAIDGYDIMERGHQGKKIGDIQEHLLMMIYEDKLSNKKPILLNYLKSN